MRYRVFSKRLLGYSVGVGVLSIAALIGVHSRIATASPPPVLIKMIDMPASYEPAKLEIKVGETVEWKNLGSSVHHASSDPSSAINPADVSNPPGAKPFDSGFLQPGQSFTYTFTVPGRYRYICAPHETSGMTGEIVVK